MLWIVSLFIALVIGLVAATFNQPVASAQNLGAASIFQYTTPSPAAEGVSEIGSTDGIFIMGVVIVFIVVMPALLFYKRKN